MENLALICLYLAWIAISSVKVSLFNVNAFLLLFIDTLLKNGTENFGFGFFFFFSSLSVYVLRNTLQVDACRKNKQKIWIMPLIFGHSCAAPFNQISNMNKASEIHTAVHYCKNTWATITTLLSCKITHRWLTRSMASPLVACYRGRGLCKFQGLWSQTWEARCSPYQP